MLLSVKHSSPGLNLSHPSTVQAAVGESLLHLCKGLENSCLFFWYRQHTSLFFNYSFERDSGFKPFFASSSCPGCCAAAEVVLRGCLDTGILKWKREE